MKKEVLTNVLHHEIAYVVFCIDFHDN